TAPWRGATASWSPRWVTASPRGAGITSGLTCAPRSLRSARPAALILRAALTSRSWTLPHGQVHDRVFNGSFSPTAPQSEHMRVDGKNRSTFTKARPYRAALYSNMAVNIDHPASWTLLASRVRAK